MEKYLDECGSGDGGGVEVVNKRIIQEARQEAKQISRDCREPSAQEYIEAGLELNTPGYSSHKTARQALQNR